MKSKFLRSFHGMLGVGLGAGGPLHSTQLQGVLCLGLPFFLWIVAFTASPGDSWGEWACSGRQAHCIGGAFSTTRHLLGPPLQVPGCYLVALAPSLQCLHS